MDNRDDFLRDTDINAQRRHRRRGSAGDESSEAPYRRPVRPETGEPKVDFRKPVMPAAEETEAGENAESETKTGFTGDDTRRLNMSGTDTSANDDSSMDRMQRADSRVPAEARRMAAAPYGTGRPEPRRPGTRPMVAPPRPAVSSNSAGTERPNGRALAKELRKQAAVGYAPGRMNEGYTKQIPAQTELQDETAKDEYGFRENREARA